MLASPSLLSLAAAAFYCVVVLASAMAAGTAAKLGQPTFHRNAWLALAALFTVLIVLRGFGIEDWFRAEMRDVMRSGGSYGDRRGMQGILVSTVLVGVAAAGFWWAYRSSRLLRGRRNIAVVVALVSGTAMVFLISLRLISLHAVDQLLYGPIKLNWVGDIGTSLIVLLAAGYYVKLVRDRP